VAQRKPKKRRAKRWTFSPEAQDALAALLDLALRTQGAKAYPLVKLIDEATEDGKG